MGLFNALHFNGECPRCGFTGEFIAEFKLGSLEQRNYRVGDRIDWSGPIRDYDPPEDGYAADHGFVKCRQCQQAFWVWITAEAGVIAGVAPSAGPDLPADD